MAATGSGYLVPEPPLVAPDAAVAAKDATADLAIGDYGKNITNTGAGDTIVLTLLAAALAAGMAFRVQLTAAFVVTLTPASGEKIYLGGSGVVDESLSIAGVIGNYVDIYCDGEKHMVIDYSGVLTKA